MNWKTLWKKSMPVVASLFLAAPVVAQSVPVTPDNWQLLDPARARVYGTSVNRAYAELL